MLTEGRGSNAGTCLINLKPWSERKMTSKQIIEQLEHEGRKMSNVKLEFFEPPAVPGFGAAGGFSMRVLDKTNTMDYKRLGEVTEKFLAALAKRKEVKGLFTFFASNYPQYEIVINNDVAMQKGVSIEKAMDNLSIVDRQHLGARLHPLRPVLQGLCPGQAAVPAVSRGFGEHVRQERSGGNGPLLLVHDAQEDSRA